jgi:hypothetical protein
MNFVNFWQRPITLGIAATEANLDLPDGYYQLVITDAPSVQAATVWEVTGASVSTGVATLFRGLEGTTPLEWPSGSLVLCSITAGSLDDLFAVADSVGPIEARVTALEAAAGGGAVAAEVGQTLDWFDLYTPAGPMLGYLPNGAVKISVYNGTTWTLADLITPA